MFKLVWSYKTGLERRGYHIYKIDPCLFHRKESFILTYVDDYIIVSHKQETITSLIELLKNAPSNYVLTYEGYLIVAATVNLMVELGLREQL